MSSAGGAPVERRVFRSSPARWFGYAWLLFAALNVVDLVARGHDRGALVTAAFLLLATAVVYVTCLRPRIVAEASVLRVTNPLRDIVVPWSEMDRVDATYAIRLHTRDGRRFSCWALHSPSRRRARAREWRRSRGTMGARTIVGGPPRTAQNVPAGRTHTDFVASQLEEIVEVRRRSADRDGGGARARWSVWAIVSLAATVAFVAGSLLVP
ncbi:MAG: hypothetical protein ACRDN9_12185 [Streptosporangiaceae bacterium]